MFTSSPRRTAGPHSDADWGPARRDREHPLHNELADTTTFEAVDLRDGDDRWPDDN